MPITTRTTNSSTKVKPAWCLPTVFRRTLESDNDATNESRTDPKSGVSCPQMAQMAQILGGTGLIRLRFHPCSSVVGKSGSIRGLPKGAFRRAPGGGTRQSSPEGRVPSRGGIMDIAGWGHPAFKQPVRLLVPGSPPLKAACPHAAGSWTSPGGGTRPSNNRSGFWYPAFKQSRRPSVRWRS
jgi:hypothetical protein